MIRYILGYNDKRSWRSLAGISVLIATLAALAGCSSYEKLPQQTYDSKYQLFSATSGKSGEVKLYLIKAFEVEGKTAMCGGYTKGSSAISNKVSRNWADISQVYLDGTKLGNADFMAPMPVYGMKVGDDPKEIWTRLANEKPMMNCVLSDKAWRPEFQKATFERKGPNRITGFD